MRTFTLRREFNTLLVAAQLELAGFPERPLRRPARRRQRQPLNSFWNVPGDQIQKSAGTLRDEPAVGDWISTRVPEGIFLMACWELQWNHWFVDQ